MSDPSEWQALPSLITNAQQQTTPFTSDSKSPQLPSLRHSTTPISILPKPPTIPVARTHYHRKILQPHPYPPISHSIYPYQNKHGMKERQGNQRNRTIRACDVCRRKKIKCKTNSLENTCTYCKSINIECTFTDSGKKRGSTRGYTETLEDRLERMEHLLSTILEQPHAPSSNEKRKLSQDNFSSSATVHKETQDIIVYDMESPSQDMTDSFDISSLSTELRTRFIGDRSPLNFLGDKLGLRNSFVTRTLGFRIKKIGHTLVFKPDDDTDKNGNQRFLERLGMLKPGESTVNGINTWIYKISGLDKNTSDSLLKIYFAYIHPKLPVLNKYLFLRQYREEFNEYPSAPLLNAIYGAAARYLEICKKFGDQIKLDNNVEMKEGQSEYFFDCLIVYVQRKYSPCISTVQAVLIGQNHKFGLDQRVGSRWLLSSVAIRMAQDLGLHRSCEDWDIPVSEKETRKRVWWSVYILDRWTAAGTGRPQTIYDDDCDVDYPTEYAEWEEVTDALPNKDKGDDDDQLRFPCITETPSTNGRVAIYRPFVELCKLSKILGDILQGLYTPAAKQHSEKHGSDAVVTYIDDTLSKWRSDLPEEFNFNDMKEKNASLLSTSGMIYASYYTLLILLHRPFIEKEGGPNTRSSQSSLSICTSAATRILDVALKLNYRDWLLMSWNFVIYPVFTAAVIHINNATSPDKRLAQLAKENMVKSSTFIKNLAATSPGAAQLHYILDQLTKLRDITTGTDKILENFASKHGYTKTRFVPESTTQAEAPYKRVVIADNHPTTKSDSRSSSLEASDMKTDSYSKQLHHHENSPLYPSVSQQDARMFLPEVESYSLRQFGFSMDANDVYSHQLGNPIQPMYTVPDHSTLDNFGFVTSNTQIPYNEYPLIDQTTSFRNGPDNAFWSVPSSMVLDDWLAYFLPQQPNAEESSHQHWI